MKKLYLILGSLGILFVLWFFLGFIFQALLLIPIISGWIEPFGLGKYFTFVIAIPIFFWIYFAIKKIFSINKWNRITGLSMVLGFAITIMFALGMQTKDYRFDPETGAPLYSFSRDGLGELHLHSGNMKFDPRTGKKASPLTPEALEELEKSRHEAEVKEKLEEKKEAEKKRNEALLQEEIKKLSQEAQEIQKTYTDLEQRVDRLVALDEAKKRMTRAKNDLPEKVSQINKETIPESVYSDPTAQESPKVYNYDYQKPKGDYTDIPSAYHSYDYQKPRVVAVQEPPTWKNGGLRDMRKMYESLSP